ncbi:MAG: hypothetical protein AAFO63_05945 [Pseudomonadota bacterium]
MRRKIENYRPFDFSPDFTPDANRGQSVTMQQQDLLALIADTREATAQLARNDVAQQARHDLERVITQQKGALKAVLALVEQLNQNELSRADRDEARAALKQIASTLVDGQHDLFEQITALHLSETNLSEFGSFD